MKKGLDQVQDNILREIDGGIVLTYHGKGDARTSILYDSGFMSENKIRRSFQSDILCVTKLLLFRFLLQGRITRHSRFN